MVTPEKVTPQQEFKAARQEVGVTLKANGNWLLKFARMPLRNSGPDTQERELLWHGLVALGILATRREDKLGDTHSHDLDDAELSIWRDANQLRRPFRFDPPDEPVEKNWKYLAWWDSVCRLHLTLAQLLDDFLRHGEVSVPLQDAQYLVSRHSRGRLHFPLNQITIGRADARSGVDSAVLFRFGKVLGALGSRVKLCAGKSCETKIFIAGRTDQKYCTRNCQMRHHMMRERASERQPSKRRRRS